MLDLSQWQPGAGEKPLYKVWLLDSHRPLHHSNLLDAKNVYVVDDGTIDFKGCPQRSDLQLIQEPGRGGDTEPQAKPSKAKEDVESKAKLTEGEVENLEEAAPAEGAAEAPKETKAESEAQNEEEEEGDEEEVKEPIAQEQAVVQPLGRKRRRKYAEETQERKRLADGARAKMEHYYRESYTGRSVAGLLYLLCQQLRLDSNNVLWLWVVGLSDQFISHRISLRDYEREVLELQREVLRLNIRFLAPEEARFKSLASARRIGGIALEKDLNLAFLRHWTLFDSLAHSEATVPRLRNWHEQGQRALQRLVAKLGVPLQDAQQKFGCLNPKYKEPLKERMVEVAPEFDLHEVYVSAFLLCVDHRATLHSLDLAGAIRAVLGYRGCFHGLAAQGEKPAERPGAAAHLQDNFWCVFYQLLDKNMLFFEKAVQQGIEQQKRLIALCFEVVEKKLIKLAPGFKCAVLEQEVRGEAELLDAHLLERLAQLLLDVCREAESGRAADAPLLLAVLNREEESYSVVGVEGARRRGQGVTGRSSFGGCLKQAAENAQVRYSYDSFESFFIKVHAKDFENFLDALRSVLSFGE